MHFPYCQKSRLFVRPYILFLPMCVLCNVNVYVLEITFCTMGTFLQTTTFLFVTWEMPFFKVKKLVSKELASIYAS